MPAHGSPVVKIWWDKDIELYRLLSPYNEGFVQAFKQAFPASDYMWDREARNWTFHEKHLANVQRLVEFIYKVKPQTTTRSEAEQASSTTVSRSATIDVVVMEFFKLVPYEAMQKAYRHAALLNHPDRGGSAEQMSKMNAAWQRLEREFYKRC